MAKVSVVSILMALTFLYAIHHKRFISNLTSNQGPILKELPAFETKELWSGAPVNPEKLFEKGNSLAMVHFWGTWCAPCELEFPGLMGLVKKFDLKEMVVLLLAVHDDEERMKKYLKRFGKLPQNILVAHDPGGELLAHFGTHRVPETYLFGRRGKILNKWIGPQDWEKSHYFNQVQFYLNIPL